MLSHKNPGFGSFIQRVQTQVVDQRILLEEEVEEAIAKDLGRFRRFGYDLQLYHDPARGITGRQVTCTGTGGRIDLLCRDRRVERLVVIELKVIRASQETFGQISNYMGWVQDRIAGGSRVVGIVISDGYDAKFESALKTTDRISHIELAELGFRT
jgi:hypothetical protein